jgi:hypothetical protein
MFEKTCPVCGFSSDCLVNISQVLNKKFDYNVKPAPVECAEALHTYKIECPVCGVYYYILLTVYRNIKEMIQLGANENELLDEKVALIRHCIYNNNYSNNETEIFVDEKWCKKVCTKPFPKPDEKLKCLIEFLGKELKYPGMTYEFGNSSDNLLVNKLKLISATASINDKNLDGICSLAAKEELIKLSPARNEKILCLTYKGYEKYEEILKSSLRLCK